MDRPQDLDVLIVIPCFNEAKRLPQTAFWNFAEKNASVGFLFVDDGSSDTTPSVIRSFVDRNPGQFKALYLPQNKGKAEAVRQGMMEGFKRKIPLVGFWDADLATPLDAVISFRDWMKENSNLEMVFGSRVRLMGRDIRRKALRHYLGRIFATCASVILKLAIYDTQCGAKLFRRNETLETVFNRPFHSKWIFDVELLARYLNLKRQTPDFDPDRKIYELPLDQWRDVTGSNVGPWDFVMAFSELISILWNYRIRGEFSAPPRESVFISASNK